jgi:4-hydroxybutyrate CoA-transferase
MPTLREQKSKFGKMRNGNMSLPQIDLNILSSLVHSSLKEGSAPIRIFVHAGAATPLVLLRNLVDQAHRLPPCEMIHLHTETPPDLTESLVNSFRIVNLFVGKNMRRFLNYDSVDYLPIFLSETPSLFRLGRYPLDVAFVHLSPPDQHGFCSLGTSVDCARAATESAKYVIAQINPQMPRVHGDGLIHISKVTQFVEVDEALPEVPSRPLSAVARKIGENVASIVEDGSTLQAGIGAIPDACMAALKGHQHLGIHSEMWSDYALELMKSGAVDNSKKVVHPGKTVSTFVTGSRAVYDYLDDNPSVIQLEADYVNHPNIIARNPKVVAINSCVEIDLSGQVCADSVGSRIISGVGGQMDFMRGAALSTGGQPIMALSSRSEKGFSRFVNSLRPHSGVTTTRSHIHWVVTEYGARNLVGLTLYRRAQALIELAHPDDRERLRFEWKKELL